MSSVNSKQILEFLGGSLEDIPTSKTTKIMYLYANVQSVSAVQLVSVVSSKAEICQKNELKARGTLLMALPDKHQLKFNIHKDSKSLMEAIEKRLQKLISQLEILGEPLSQEDTNLKFLRSLPTEWRTHTLIWRNKADLKDQSLDELFNNLKIYELSIKALVSTLPNVDNLSDAIIYSFFASQSNSLQLNNEDLKQINADDSEEMDLKWQMAMLTMRARRFLQRTGRNLGANGTTPIGFDMSKVDEEPTNYALMAFTSSSSSSSPGSDSEVALCSKACSKAYATLQSHYDKLTVDFRKSQFDVLSYKSGLEYVEARLVVYQQNENVFEEDIKLLKLNVMLRDNALVELRKKFEKLKKKEMRYDNQMFTSTMFDCAKLNSFESDDSMPISPVHNRYKLGEGYHVVPPPYTRTFMPPKPDLVFHDASPVSETVPNVFNVKPRTTTPTKDMSQSNRPSAHIIEDWVSDSEDNLMPVEHPTQAENLRKDIPKSKGHKHSWNRKACFVCKSLNHLIKNYDFYEKQMVQKPVRNHAVRVNHQNYARMTHPHSNKHVVPTAVLTRSRLVPFNAARPVTTVVPQTIVHNQIPVKHVVNKSHSPIRRVTREISLGPQKTLSFLFDVHGNPQLALQDKGVIDSGCSRHMTGNISYLPDFEEINGGYVTFGGNPKGGKITGKGKIKTGKLDFDDVYFVKELKFNLFTVSQMCDKKNNFLFTDTECVVLSSDFKLPDENHVLLRVPRENNMYNVDLKNIVPSGYLTYLFVKASLNETPSIGFMRPFGCLVTILNTLDPLGKFNGKAGEGSLVRYFVTSKAFRVFNSRTRIVQETLHIIFFKNQSKVEGSGPKWLFDINTLTQSMNYQPVAAGNRPNFSAGIQGNFKADNEFKVHVSSSSSDKSKKHDKQAKREAKGKSPVDLVNAASAPVTAIGPNSTNSTNSLNAAGPSDTAEEGIDYEEVFAPLVRIEAIWLFLAYASFMGFMVYQMDVKSAFLYGTIKEEVYVCQPIGFKDPDYPDKVYKVVKALYGLHQAPKAWYKTLANYLLENSFQKGKIDHTLFIKKQKGDILLVQDKFQMSSMGELTFFLGLQVNQIDDGIFISQDKYVAKILRKFGHMDGKSASTPIDTKKPLLKDPDGKDVDTVVATSSTEADYVAAASCCAQVLWIQNQLMDYGKKVIITEDTIRQDLWLDGVDCLPNEEIFAELAQEDEDDELSAAPTPPSPTPSPTSLPPQQVPIPSPLQAQPAQPSLPTQQQPTQPADTSESLMTLLNTLMETCATLTQKVSHLEQDKVAQALEITKLKQRVRKLEKKRRSKSSGLKRLRKEGEIAELDANEDVTLVDVDADIQGRMEEDVTAVKDINAAESEPTIFDDEDVTMTMAQTLVKIKAKKARILDEQIVKRLQDEEIEQAAARKKQDKEDLQRAKVLQQQYDQKQESIDWNVVAEQMQEKHLDNIKKYQSLKRKPISVAQARKNMVVYFKIMAGYKIQHFKGMTYDQESFKKLRAEVEVLIMIKIGGITQAFQSFEDMLKDFDREDLDALWRITKEKFSITMPTHKLHPKCGVHQVSSTTTRYDIYMLAEKDYPLSNQVMALMLSSRLQVEEDSEVARDLVMKIFLKANQSKSKSLDTSSN
nr:putative ribonuclease H-like domain-containing protein [Tanacetum cinerariifolium]